MIPLYLLDASAVYPIILRMKEEAMKFSHIFSVLDLTFYEVGNVLWKEFRRGRLEDWKTVVEMFEEFFSEVGVRRMPDMGDILELAVNENLTFYDASYLVAARENGMKLVTGDRDLLRFPECMSVEDLVRELKGLED